MEPLTSADQIQACVALIADPENWLKTAAYGGGFVLFTIFALVKKSLPQFVIDIAKGIINAIPKKKK